MTHVLLIVVGIILALWIIPVLGVLLCAAGYAVGGPIGAVVGLVAGVAISAWGSKQYVNLPRE